MKFIYGTQVGLLRLHLQKIEVKFVHQCHRFKVKVTAVTKCVYCLRDVLAGG